MGLQGFFGTTREGTLLLFLFSMPKWKTGFTQHLWIAGFIGPLAYCCGHVDGARCWETSIVNGTEVFADSCNDPSKYISWDAAHYTEAANKWVANHILDGSLSDPPIPLTKACHKPDSPNWGMQPSSSSFCLSSQLVPLNIRFFWGIKGCRFYIYFLLDLKVLIMALLPCYVLNVIPVRSAQQCECTWCQMSMLLNIGEIYGNTTWCQMSIL